MIEEIQKKISREKDEIRRNYKAEIKGSNERTAINRLIKGGDCKSRVLEIP